MEKALASGRGRAAPVTAAAVLALPALLWPLADRSLPVAPGITSLWCAAVLLCDLFTAVLLMSRFRSSGDARLLVLTGAFAWSAGTVMLYMVALPGVLIESPTLGAENGSIGWLWVSRHVGPPVLIAMALAPWPDRVASWASKASVPSNRKAVSACWLTGVLVAGPVAAFTLVRFAPHLLPSPMETLGVFTPWVARSVLVITAMCVAVGAIGVRRRNRTVGLEAWALVAVAAWFSDVVFTLMYEERYTVGYYAARLLGIAASLIVLSALLREIGRLHSRLLIGASDLEERVSDLLQAAQQRDHLVATVSHEMRQPLTGLQGYLEMLSENEDVSPDLARTMHRRSWLLARRLTLLTEDLLTSASSERVEISLHAQDLPLAQQVAECLQGFPGLQARVLIDEDVVVRADPLRLQQILSNLVRNAQRHGAEPVTIAASSLPSALGEGERVKVMVADEGAGVTHEFVPHLFQRHTRSRDATTPGFGLGLSIVGDLVRAHGGTVGYEATLRAFFFTLPRAAVMADQLDTLKDPVTTGRRAHRP